jgi:predicted Zn finger-like uncharacterized protein
MTDTFLTRCPQCQTIFRLTASQLKKAKGKVRCGSCSLVFNAQGHLLNPPQAPIAAKPTSPPVAKHPAPKPNLPNEDDFFDLYAKPTPAVRSHKPPQFIDSIVDERSRYNNLDQLGKIEVPGEIDPGMHTINRDKTIFNPPPAEAPAKPAKPANAYEDTADKEKPTDIDDLEGINALYEVADAEIARPTTPELSDEIILGKDSLPVDDFDFTDLPTADEQAQTPASKLDLSYIEDSFLADADKAAKKPAPTAKIKPSRREPQMPFSLRSSYAELETEPRAYWMTPLLSLAILVLVTGLVLQTMLFRSTQLVEHFPRLTGPMTWFCARLPCRYSGARDLSQIELVSRDVRSHPSAKNALLIHVTLINQAKFKQPYPTLLLSLSNLNGQIVARRQFSPQEYLDKVYTPFLRMESETPVHITLAVIDPGDDAMNFEFSFQ